MGVSPWAGHPQVSWPASPIPVRCLHNRDNNLEILMFVDIRLCEVGLDRHGRRMQKEFQEPSQPFQEWELQQMSPRRDWARHLGALLFVQDIYHVPERSPRKRCSQQHIHSPSCSGHQQQAGIQNVGQEDSSPLLVEVLGSGLSRVFQQAARRRINLQQ